MSALHGCTQCGMVCEPNEYHPYAACMMYRDCHDSETVRANLNAVVEHGRKPAPCPHIASSTEGTSSCRLADEIGNLLCEIEAPEPDNEWDRRELGADERYVAQASPEMEAALAKATSVQDSANVDFCAYGLCQPHEKHAPGCVEYTPEELAAAPQERLRKIWDDTDIQWAARQYPKTWRDAFLDALEAAGLEIVERSAPVYEHTYFPTEQGFIDSLYAAGWRSPCDAQWEQIKALYAELARSRLPVAVPEDVMKAAERMAMPLHESRLSGVTAQQDAECSQRILRFLQALSAAPEASDDQ